MQIEIKTIRGLDRAYAHTSQGQLLAIINSMGYLEISANQDSACHLCNADKGDKVEVI